MAAFRSILLIGASGNIGAPMLKAFIENGSYDVSVLTRNESTSVFPTGIKVHKADYAVLADLQRAMEGQDVVISMVGGIAAGDQDLLIDAAVAMGVKRFFPSEYGHPRDPEFAKVNHVVIPTKAATVDYLKTKESQMSWTGVVTGGFFDWSIEVGFAGFDVSTNTAGLIDDGQAIFSSCNLSYVAQAVLAILKHPEETKNQYVHVGEFNVSQRDILNALEKVQGVSWTIKHLRSEDVIASGEKQLADGDYRGVMDLTRAGAFGKMRLGDNRKFGLWDERLGLKGVSLEQAIRDVLVRLGQGVKPDN